MIKIKERSIIVKVDFLTEDDVWNERRNVLNKLSITFYNNASLFDFYHVKISSKSQTSITALGSRLVNHVFWIRWFIPRNTVKSFTYNF